MNNKFLNYTNAELLYQLQDETVMHELLHDPLLPEILTTRPYINLFTLVYYFNSEISDNIQDQLPRNDSYDLIHLTWDFKTDQPIDNPDRLEIIKALCHYMELIKNQ